MDGKMLLAIRAIELYIIQSDYSYHVGKKTITYKRRNLFHKMLQQTRLPGISQGPWPLG
jgi:hypothetical protein